MSRWQILAMLAAIALLCGCANSAMATSCGSIIQINILPGVIG